MKAGRLLRIAVVLKVRLMEIEMNRVKGSALLGERMTGVSNITMMREEALVILKKTQDMGVSRKTQLVLRL